MMANANETSPAETHGPIATLPFRSQQIDDPDANYDVSVWRLPENVCELHGTSACDTGLGIYYGSAEDEATKFCPRHYYEMHSGEKAGYKLVDQPEERQIHPQRKRICEAMTILHDVLKNWNEDEIDDYPIGMPSFDEYLAEIGSKLYSIEWNDRGIPASPQP